MLQAVRFVQFHLCSVLFSSSILCWFVSFFILFALWQETPTTARFRARALRGPSRAMPTPPVPRRLTPTRDPALAHVIQWRSIRRPPAATHSQATSRLFAALSTLRCGSIPRVEATMLAVDVIRRSAAAPHRSISMLKARRRSAMDSGVSRANLRVNVPRALPRLRQARPSWPAFLLKAAARGHICQTTPPRSSRTPSPGILPLGSLRTRTLDRVPPAPPR